MSTRAGRAQRLGLTLVAIALLRPSGGSLSREAPARLAPPPLPEAWLSAARAAAARSEYAVTPSPGPGPSRLQAPNRGQAFRALFDADGVRIAPRAAEAGGWEVGLRLAGAGLAGAVKPVAAGRLEAVATRAEYVRGAITEWYLNDENGLEQGFTLAAPPAGGGEGPLRLDLAVTGNARPTIVDEGRAVAFEHEGRVVLRYSGLRSWDARGRELPSRMEMHPGTALSLIVDVAGAEYPVTVDPLVSSPSWTKEGGQAGASLGGFVASAGDVNGDGYADVVLGAPYFDVGGADTGRAFVYHGSATGPSAVPDWTTDGLAPGALHGAVAGAGDVNGDGYDDVIVGAPGTSNGNATEGRASVYLGGPSGLALTPSWTAEGEQDLAAFGAVVAGAGDVNRDGYADVLVGAPNYTNGETNEGRVFVYYGSASGPGSTPWTAESNQASALFGSAVAGGGDVNGDGYDDVAVGAPYFDSGPYSDNGQLFLYHGSPAGLPGGPSAQRGPSTAPTAGGAHLGQAVAWAGDVDGDGYCDLLAGEPNWEPSAFPVDVGRATLYRGGPAGIAASPVWTTSLVADSRWGLTVASAGDVNGDGYADWLVAAPYYDSPATDGGYVQLFQGRETAAIGSVSATQGFTSAQAGTRMGMSAGSAGDVDGDGLSDVLIGADGYDGSLTDQGLVSLHNGRVGIGASPVWQVESNIYGGRLGWSVAALGDVNGDGYADVAGGAPRIGDGTVFVYHGSPSGLPTTASWSWERPEYGVDTVGRAISSADVNGDGYADLVVGDFNWSNPETQEGRVFVFHGSASGLSPSPSWVYESNVASSQFGLSVTGVGDVNGDGYEDVLVGAPAYTGGAASEGAVFLFLGSPTGLSPTFDWFVTGGQANLRLGGETSRGVHGRAGDVNGDGYADIALGESTWNGGQSNEGRVIAFYGGPSGPGFTPSWTFESNQADAQLGIQTSTAGDVNGDGYADLVAGAYAYDNGQTDEGRVFVFHGGHGGLAPTASWTWESNTTSDRVCRAAGLGDVDGDGFGDLVIYDKGYVFLGSPTGLSSSYAQTTPMQTAVAAGDVDGDGFADVLRSYDQYTSGGVTQIDEGALYLHSTAPGPAGGRKVLARMLRGGSSGAPVQPWGRTYHPSEFKTRLTSTSFRGRGVAYEVEVEACPPGVAFGHASCVSTVSPGWTELTSAAGATDTFTLAGLASRTLYRWRARTLYAPATVLQPGISPPPKPAHGPWRRVLAQSREADLRTDQGITVGLTQGTSTVDETNLQTTFGATMATADGQPNLYPVTVQYQTADGTATAGSDYTATTSTITWDAGIGSTVTQYRNIPLAGGDGLSEGPETFSIGLSSPANATLAAPTSQVVTIVDSDPPLVSIGDASVVEGDSGTATATFTVTLSYASAAPASVSWTTIGGSASPGSDFVAGSGTVSFAAFETSRTVQVTVNGDTLDEGDETFQVALSNPSGADPGDMTATGTIENDDGPAGDAVEVFAATAGNGRADLEWVFPAGRDTVRIRYSQGAACSPPTDPESEGTLLGGSDLSGTAGQPGLAPHDPLANGTQYCYRIWTVLGVGSYAIGGTTHARPFDNSPGQPAEPIAWAYATGAASVAAPGLGGDAVLAVSNDSLVHAVGRGAGAGGGLWPAGYVARRLGGPAQERPPLIPLPVVPGAAAFTLLGSQDGGVYAVDAGRGGIKWRTPLLPSGTEVQAAPSAFFASHGAPFGIDFDVVVAGTRNGGGAGGTANRFYALDARTGAVLGTPFDNGGVADIGFVSGSASLDYPSKRAYFTSRSAGSMNTLWCFDVSGGGLTPAWARPAGEIDASPVLRGGVVYTSTIDGDVMAYGAGDGAPRWTTRGAFPTEAGGVKGFVFPDRLSQRLYFSTTTKVWAIRDVGADWASDWSSAAASSSPSTPVFGDLGGTGYVFVGGSDGRLYQLDAATGTDVRSVPLGGPTDAVGAPTLDNLHSMVYVGSAAGVVYAVKVPLP